MITLTLIRVCDNLGLLFGPSGKVCYIMEPEWRNNQTDVSCIPKGEYTVDYMARSASGKYRDVYHVAHVKNRYGVLIHKGNLLSQTRGCLIPGARVGTLGGKFAVLGSSQAMRKIHIVTNRESFKLNIV